MQEVDDDISFFFFSQVIYFCCGGIRWDLFVSKGHWLRALRHIYKEK